MRSDGQGQYFCYVSAAMPSVLRYSVGDLPVCRKVLEHAGVYKRTNEGKNAFLRFIDAVNQA